MTTRLDLRLAVRRRVEDTGVSPLWDDAALNDFLSAAMRGYGACFPAELSTTVNVAAGARIAVVSPAIESSRVLRVFDDAGRLVPRQRAIESPHFPPAESISAQSWRWWGATLLLTNATATTGFWQIDYLGWRTLPSDDVTAVDVLLGDEEIVVLLAVSKALSRRAIEDGKRGLGRSAATMLVNAAAAGEEAASLIARRRMRARGAWLSLN